MASVTGPRDAVDTLLSRLDLADAEILGPVPVDAAEHDALEPGVRALVRVPRTGGASLARALVRVAGGAQRPP